MARNLIVLALIFIAVSAAVVSAQSPTASPKAAPKSSPYNEETAPTPIDLSSDTAGASPESSPLAPASEYYSAVSTPPAPAASGPVKGPSEFSFDEAAPAPNGGYGLDVSVVVGVAAVVAGFGFLV